MGPENGSPQPIELGAILEPKLIKNEVDEYAEICHSKMRNRVGNGGQNGARNTTKSLKTTRETIQKAVLKQGLRKQRRRQKRMRFEVPKTSESTVRSSQIMVLGGAKKT